MNAQSGSSAPRSYNYFAGLRQCEIECLASVLSACNSETCERRLQREIDKKFNSLVNALYARSCCILVLNSSSQAEPSVWWV